MSSKGVDRRELSRLIALSFSAGELSKYAERWRVFTDREGSADDAARVLVRAIDARGKLAQLMDSLRAHKPLVEWPDFHEAPEQEPADEQPAEEAAVGEAASEARAGVEERAGLEERAPGEDADGGEPDTAKDDPPLQPIVDPFFIDDDEPEEEDDDPVKPYIVMAAILVGGIAIGGVGVWLFTRGPADETDDAAAAPATLAVLAASEVRRSVTSVQQACEVEAGGDSARQILTRAFDTCSIPEIEPSKIQPYDVRPRSRPAPRSRLVQPRKRPPARSPACLDRCHAVHGSCKDSKCGSEPASAGAFESYQRCLQGCMSEYARCRLSCR